MKSVPITFQQRLEVVAGVGLLHLGHLFRRPYGDDLATLGAAFRPQVHQPVSGLDHVQVVFDHHHGVAVVTKAVQHVEQLLDIGEVQACGRLVEDIQGLAGVALGQLAGQLDPLGFTAGQRGCRLPQLDIRQADIHQRLELARQGRHRVEEHPGLLDGHL